MPRVRRGILVFLALYVVVLTAWVVHQAWVKRQTGNATQIATKPLDDSTQAALTAAKADRDSLRVLLQAAKQLNGQLVAAVRLAVQKRETTYIHQTLETVRYGDSSRIAYFQDSASWYLLKAKIVAPPFPAALVLDSLTLTRPAFNPAVGFIRSGNAHFAVVTWQDERVQVQVPFSTIQPPPPRVIPYVRAAYSPVGAVMGSAGMGFRLGKHLEPYAEIMALGGPKQPDPVRIWLGTTWKF